MPFSNVEHIVFKKIDDLYLMVKNRDILTVNNKGYYGLTFYIKDVPGALRMDFSSYVDRDKLYSMIWSLLKENK